MSEYFECIVVIHLGIYLLDIIYIDSAYPASESIIETEQRTNQMNNVLRVISDLQMSCSYGKKHKDSPLLSVNCAFIGFSKSLLSIHPHELVLLPLKLSRPVYSFMPFLLFRPSIKEFHLVQDSYPIILLRYYVTTYHYDFSIASF